MILLLTKGVDDNKILYGLLVTLFLYYSQLFPACTIVPTTVLVVICSTINIPIHCTVT